MNEMEQQVWQRVHAGPGPQGGMELRPLMLASAENIGAYRALVSSARHREKARQLLEGERENLAALRGMCRLAGTDPGQLMPGRSAPVGQGTLEGCYRRSHRLLMEYMARSAEPEFGTVFRCLAQRQEKLCAVLAELAGAWPQG